MLRPNAKAIERLRIAQGYSQHKLSLNAGLSGTSIMRIEKGISFSIHHLRASAIANVLNCKVEDLFTPIIKK